jgi:hypothetical protein
MIASYTGISVGTKCAYITEDNSCEQYELAAYFQKQLLKIMVIINMMSW